MSLRIRIFKTSTQAADPLRQHNAKRRIDSDDEADAAHPKEPSEEPEAKKPRLKRSRTVTPAEDEGESEIDVEAVPEVDADVDVEGEEEEDTHSPPASEHSSLPSPRPYSKPTLERNSPIKSRPKRVSRRPKRFMWSDDEDEKQEQVGPRHAENSDDGFTQEPVQPTSKRGAGKSNEGKASAGAKSVRGKAKKGKEDERKLHPVSSATTLGAGPSTKRAHPKDEPIRSSAPVPGAAAGVKEDDEQPPLPVKAKEPTPPALKKRKLPTIKKNKPATGTAPSTPVTTKPPPVTVTGELEGNVTDSKLNVGVGVGGRRAVMANTADVDLRDSSVYAQLFQKAGGSTPNSGLNRKEKEEERRRELNRMREEARAKRAEEAKYSFDLQAANEKIQRFEEKLRSRGSTAIYPNIIGAAFMPPQDRVRKSTNEERKER